MVDFKSIETFLWVVKLGSFRGAAQRLNTTQPAISQHLAALRSAGLAKAARCGKTYPSLEELVTDDKIEAVFCATDAPSHAKHVMEVLKHGKHAARKQKTSSAVRCSQRSPSAGRSPCSTQLPASASCR